MRAGMVKRGLKSSVLLSLYVNDLSTPLHRFNLALYADYSAVIITSRKPTLLVIYLDSYLTDFRRRLSEWRIAISVSKSSAMILVRAGRRFIWLRTVSLFGEPIELVATT
jgi:hypothetical protein